MIIIFTILAGFTGCQLVDVLDQDPMYQLDLEGAITTPEMAELALNGTYSKLSGVSLNYTYAMLSGSFMSGTMLRQSYVTSGNIIYMSERFLNILSYSSFGDEEWSADYGIIKNVNFLLKALEGISEDRFAAGRKAEIIGESHFLRALAYFRLLVQFGEYWDPASAYGVIIRTDLPAVSSAVRARATVAESYTEIFKNLTVALAQAPAYTKSTQASVQAAKALKAKVLFYQGEWAAAATAADEAITDKNPLENKYADVFKNASTSKEVLFCRDFGTNELSSVTSYTEKAFGVGHWGPTDSYMAVIAGDPREDAVVWNKNVVYNELPYNINTVKKMYKSGGVVPVLFLRTAELYLIRAEALARSNASVADAWAPVRALRNRAGSTSIGEPATREALMDEIFNEWLIEMSFENWHEWFAVQRFGKLFEQNKSLSDQLALELKKGQGFYDAYIQRATWRRIYNIPTREIDANPACVQNPGY